MSFTKFFAAAFLIAAALSSCADEKNTPDVSDIKVSLTALRFDKDFFSMDTANAEAALTQLQKKYPLFLNDFLYNILALPPQQDSILQKVKLFIHDYKPIYDSVQLHFASTEKEEKEIKRGLQMLQYYFPKYQAPDSIIFFVGPLEGYANVLTQTGFAVGLQLYLGKDFSGYNNEYISNVYPQYQSRRFEVPYIAANCMKNIISDMYPENNVAQPLVYQMIDAGKRLYVLDKLLPETADTVKTGYTEHQLEGCYEHEALIWNYFAGNDLLFSNDVAATRDYMNDGPKTDMIGEASPGFIGQFVGWQIVKKWMSINSKKTLQDLMQTSEKEIYETAHYKPQ